MRAGFLLFAVLLFVSSGGAGTTGTIEGKVRDKQTGEPIVGVSVVISGTSLGAASDLDGNFRISNVESGTYDVRFSSVGYQPIVYRDVIVRQDLRSRITAELTATNVELSEVEVIAERPLIEKDETSTMFSFGGSQVDKLPVQNVQDLLTLFPSVTPEGNVRGGKSTEVVYLVDGLPLQDLIEGGLGSSLPKSSITEFSIQTGGFEAEYGNALSGVVNIISRRGSDRFSELFRFEKDDWLPGGWDQQTNRMTEGELTLSGPIVREKVHYFSATTYQASDTRWWQDFDKFFDSPISQELSGLAKVDFTLSPKVRITTQAIYSLKSWHDYEFSWRFDLGGLPPESRNSIRTSAILSHTLSDDVHYTASLSESYMRSRIGDGPKNNLDLTPYQYDDFLEYVTKGNEAWWADSKQGIYTLKTDFDIQPNQLNIMKFGFEINQYDIFSDVVKYNPQTTYFGKVLTGLPELNYSTTYHYYPRSGSAYFQDKLIVEHDGAVVNLGMRWDFLDPRSERPVLEYLPLDTATGQYQSEITNYVKASLKQQLSPRIGLSFPLAWNVLLIMNYGHYFQFPLFDYLYSGINPQQLRNGVSVLTGNPDLKPERTHAWEIGVKYGFDEHNMLSVTYFKKEFIDQIDSKTLLPSNARSAGDFGYAEYVNNAFASAQGLEFVLTRHRAERISGSLSYTLMQTEGVSDYANQGLNLAQWGFPVANTPYPLSWDVRHSVKLEVDASLPYDIVANLVWSFSSGKPYTYYPTKDGYTPLDSTMPFIPNNARLPSNSTVNLKFSKRVSLGGLTNLTFYGYASNLLNALNARWADSNGRIGGQLGDPSAYYDPRRFSIGVKYEM